MMRYLCVVIIIMKDGNGMELSKTELWKTLQLPPDVALGCRWCVSEHGSYEDEPCYSCCGFSRDRDPRIHWEWNGKTIQDVRKEYGIK